MLESKSNFRNSLGAFDGDSSNEELALKYECVDSEGTDLKQLEEEEVLTEVVGTSRPATNLLGATNTAQYEEFLMRDTRMTDQHASYQLKTSTSGHGDPMAKVSTSTPDEGVLSVVTRSRLV